MRPFPTPPRPALAGHLALASVLLLLLLAVRWPLAIAAVPLPSVLTGRLSPDLRAAGALFAATLLAGAGCLLISGQPLGVWITCLFLAVFALVLPGLLGLYLRSTSDLAQAGWERARTLNREAELRAERARLRESSRIARDLHDAVGHELSLLSLGAGSLEMAADLPEERRRQAGQLRETAGRAAEQLMAAVGVLRADTESAPLAAAGDSISELVRNSREAGLDVSLEWDDAPRELPVMADRALYRVVQESLTNAAKHAPGAAPRVLLWSTPEGVRVRVTNPVPGQGRGPRQVPGAGSGLLGLRERIRLAGGDLKAGRSGRDWVVTALVPVAEPTLPPSPGGEPSRTASRVRAAGGKPASEGDDRFGGHGASALHDVLWEGREVHIHQQVHRRTLWAIGTILMIPILMGLVGYTLLLLSSYQQAADATLTPEEFEQLRLGQDRGSVEAVLPVGELYRGTLAESSQPPDPEGLVCRYYRSSRELTTDYDRYRLCFDSVRLVSAEVLTWGRGRPW
ncbi:sensor histidine kinase [Nocardiopsis metallicus]|uniref:histidine kinase n=1 Tax=Nocardiopsis metallicus TaxID=179819 RepID=A0A840WC97_9ACTN|nr:histidine kinase [Nocardiopsis metallicus]MBB5488866.1 signal transduction histidine kinase [Nocardiopsis metallicus]